MRVLQTAALILCAASTLQADNYAKHPFRFSVPSAAIDNVIVELTAAEISIGNAESSTIALSGTAEREYRGVDDLARAQRIADDSEVRLEVRGRSLVLKRALGPRAEKNSWIEKTQFRLNLSVPKGMKVTVEQTFGELAMEGEFGDVDISMKAGEVRIKTPKKAVRELSARAHIGEVTTNLGEKVITKEGVFAGRTEYFNEGGRFRLDVNLTVGEISIVLTD